MPFLRPISDRYFEDYIEGDVHCFGTIAVEADEIVAFANRFDPQTLHTDPEAAKRGPFGGLIASGWHTAGLMTRLFMDHYLTKVASLGSPGGDELRWVKPVRPGDTLSVRVTVLKAVASKSKPDRGPVTSFIEEFNQATDGVMPFRVSNIMGGGSSKNGKWEFPLLGIYRAWRSDGSNVHFQADMLNLQYTAEYASLRRPLRYSLTD